MARRKKSKAKKRTKITKPQPIIIINEQPKNLRYWQQMLMVLIVPLFNWIKELIQTHFK
ncbi:hypothetical protein [Acinetobacter junii]|jgi:hypothetical protein|uniref:Uncharacterized protein n=1 Tax=Acinetobacter junii TaxID=40215 RepID=A0AAW5RD42_ACIJU|nr:hypothetical protein [Acinetobacter junii]MCU4397872.1 hypothetical protein [Acinetobacter junii]MCU4407637.1 hypothetical protein [Acinetobacter junii]MDH0667258.1 hypothetical protein [Acinetobacter junii]MDH1690725.1 hypothetical protein [Acinetobacter junii]MDI9720318.1 hypothetical protein [Acinetobacter junii]